MRPFFSPQSGHQRTSNDTCVDVPLQVAALRWIGWPVSSEYANSDQGSQFTSARFTDVLVERGIRISMDGRGRYLDNIFIERLWWSLKYECVYLNEFADARELGRALKGWIHFYNTERQHSALAYRTPDEAYSTGLPKAA